MAETRTTYRPGTVVRYIPDQSRVPASWCREGMAVANDRGLLVDTYWEYSGYDHIVTVAEEPSVKVLGNLDDYVLASSLPWLLNNADDYHDSDRLTVTAQHRLRRREYVRKGAQPHLGTRIRHQVLKVRDAESAAAAAARDVKWQRGRLDELLAQRAGAATPGATA